MKMSLERIAEIVRHPKFKKLLFLSFMGLLVIAVVLYGGSEEEEGEKGIFDMLRDGWEGTKGNETTDPCIVCHKSSGVLNNTLIDWRNSKHAQYDISCVDCHEADSSDPDAVSHNGYYISYVVSPEDCAQCHSQEVQEFDQSLHSFGALYYEYLFGGGKLPMIESQLEGGYLVANGQNITHGATIRGCQACHGTNMTGKTTQDFTVWPNNGIGRINPDGSRGSCSACHTRHTFSIAEARHPETCGQCHMGPDHPQIEIYMESKHGNIYSAEGDSWNWTADDWRAGIDYRAPTCASCHMSSAPGLPTTHDVSSRLSWELETPVSGYTNNKANNLGADISDGSTWQEKRNRMKTVCRQCHYYEWVDNYYEQADVVVELYNEKYLEAKQIVDDLYDDGLITTTPFDEPIEFKLYEMWHHEGRRARMGAFMQAPDFVQWHGFYDLLLDKVEIEKMAEEIRSQAAAGDDDARLADPSLLLTVLTIIVIILLVVILLKDLRRKKAPSQVEKEEPGKDSKN